MFQNNNNKSIRELGNRILFNNKWRNIVTILAIILTTILISIGFKIMFSISDSVDDIFKGIVYGNSNIENIENKVTNLEEINGITKIREIRLYSSLTENGFNTNEYEVAEKEFKEWNLFLRMPIESNFYTNNNIKLLKGHFPLNVNEIILPSWATEELGFAFTGRETVGLVVDNGDSYFSRKKGTNEIIRYKLVGIYEEDRPNATRYSELYANSPIVDNGILLLLALFIILVIISGYLIVFNIFYIHVIKDMRTYGSLRAMGTTTKQISKIINYQVYLLTIIPTIVGSVIGYFLGNIITPKIFEFTNLKYACSLSNSPWIIILSVGIIILTVRVSIIKPKSIIVNNSAIDEIKQLVLTNDLPERDEEEEIFSSRIQSMAYRNIKRGKKRSLLTYLSITLSGIIIVFALTAYFSLDKYKEALKNSSEDFTISHSSLDKPNLEYKKISPNIYESLKELPFVEKVEKIYEPILPNENGYYGFFQGQIDRKGEIDIEYEVYPQTKYERAKDLSSIGDIVGIRIVSFQDDDLSEIEKLDLLEGQIDMEVFKSGKGIIFIGTKYLSMNKEMDITFTTLDSNGKKIKVSKKLTPIASMGKIIETRGFEKILEENTIRTIVLPEKIFKEIYPNYNDYISKLRIYYKDHTDLAMAQEEIEKIMGKYDNDQIILKSKYKNMLEVERMEEGALTAGLIISVIASLIGLLNFANSVLTGILSRKTEFAILNSIGMTNMQQKKVLLFEGIFSFINSLIFLLPAGITTSIVCQRIIPIEDKMDIGIIVFSIAIVISIVLAMMISINCFGYKFLFKNRKIEDLKDSDWI